MFATIIVPLDGSTQAEAALPFAIEESGRHAARLILVRVLPRPEPAVVTRNHGGPVPVIPAWPLGEVAIDERRSDAYLRDVCRRFALGVDTRLIVAVGDPGARLIVETRLHPRPLVVVATGTAADPRSPLSDLTRRLLTSDTVPVLVVGQPAPAIDKPFLAGQLPDRYFRRVVAPDPVPSLAGPRTSHDGPPVVAIAIDRVPVGVGAGAERI